MNYIGHNFELNDTEELQLNDSESAEHGVVTQESARDAWQSILGALMSAAATRSDGYSVDVIIGGNKRTFRYCRAQDVTSNANKCFFKCDLMDQVVFLFAVIFLVY